VFVFTQIESQSLQLHAVTFAAHPEFTSHQIALGHLVPQYLTMRAFRICVQLLGG
jgi:hypothetical protein